MALAIDVRDVPHDYALRGGSSARVEGGLRAAGLRSVDAMAAGDVILFSPGAGQLHLGIFTGTGLVHADAGLRRVTERPLPLSWPVLGIWRV
ncbi:MAG TPA: peptidoglycan endopeptidase [Allosphingosinicella sp.]|nr:peptidoglycan endopeptidase [Allosphingosinicella sp.]